MQFPTLRQEDWKYTNVAPIARAGFKRARPGDHARAAQSVEACAIDGGRRPDLVFVDGRWAPGLSRPAAELPPGIVLASMATVFERAPGDPERSILEARLARYASYEDQSFVALNTAFIEDGLYLRIGRNLAIEEPIHALFLTAGGDGGPATHPRLLVIAEAGSQALFIEHHAGLGGSYFSNPVTEVLVAENARLDHFKLQEESGEAFHVANLRIELSANARYASHSFSFGGALVRNDIHPVLDGEGIECLLNGLFVAGGKQHVDTHTIIDHARPHCVSNETYRGILAGKARGVFSGRIIVRPGAVKTNAYQSNKNLLLSQDASIDSKPQLEIYADDVRCTHGATVGQLDERALFYLRSRGISKDLARKMLVQAFANELIEPIRHSRLRSHLERLLSEQLEEKT
jgi:Fe-S cluster assembly protein SufD